MFSEFSFSQKPPQESAETVGSALEHAEIIPLPDNIVEELEQSKRDNPQEPALKVGFLGEQEDKTPLVINNDGIAHEVKTLGMVSWRVTRNVGPSGYANHEFMASPSLKPPKAKYSTPDKASRPSGSGQIWVRLEADEPKANAKEPDNISDMVKRPHVFDTGTALDHIPATKASIELFARPASEDLHRKAMRDARIRVSEGDKTAAPRVEELKDHVIQTGILVSATPDTIDETVSAVKRALADKGRTLKVIVPQSQSPTDTDPSESQGPKPTFFSSREDALRHPGTTGSIRPTEQFADLVSSAWPQKSLPGLEVGKSFEFAQKAEEVGDKPGIVVGKIYNRSGVEVGPMKIPDSQGHLALIGNTGSGKTEALKRMITESARTGVPEVVLDFYKHGTYSNSLPGLLAADNIPVRSIRPGGAGILPVRLDVFGRDGDPEKITRINNLLTGLVRGNEERAGAFGKWARTSIDQQEEVIGRKLYGPRAPSIQLEMIPQALLRAFDHSQYDQRVTANMKEFTTSQWDSVLSGNFGELFNKGYPLNFEKMLEPGVTIFELKGIGDPFQKIVAGALIIFELAETLRERNGGQETDEVKIRVRLDEAQDLTQTEKFRIASEFEMLARLVRGSGIELSLIAQSLQGADKSTLGQFTKNIIMRLGTGDDQLDAAKKLGITEKESAFLGGFPGTEGRGWALASMDGNPPALTRFNLAEKTGEGTLQSPADIADLGYYRKYYSREVINEAEALLEKRPGALIRFLVEVNTLFVLGGMAPPSVADEFKQQFANLSDDVVQCAMDRAIHLAVVARRDIASLEYGADEGATPHYEFSHYLQMITDYQMNGDSLTIVVPELAWGANKFNNVARALGPPVRIKDAPMPSFSEVSRYNQLRILDKESFAILGAICASFKEGKVEPHILDRAAEFYGYKNEKGKLPYFMENMIIFARLDTRPNTGMMAFFNSVQEEINQRPISNRDKSPAHLYLSISAAMKADREYRNGEPPLPAMDLSNESNGHLFSGATYLYEQVDILLDLMDHADNKFPISDVNAIFATDYSRNAIGTILDRIINILRPTKPTIVEEAGQSLIELHEQGRKSEIHDMLVTVSNLVEQYLLLDDEQRTYLNWTIEDGNAAIAYFVKNRRPKLKGSMEDD